MPEVAITTDLKAAAQEAWRNNSRCIGRLFVDDLQLRDCRGVEDGAAVAQECFEHIAQAFNGGRAQPLITVFAPGVRIYNHLLLGYADDPMNAPLTTFLAHRGWHPSKRFQAPLPLVIESPDGSIGVYPLPDVPEVEIRSPRLPFLEEQDVRWPAIPILSDMQLWVTEDEVYTAAPFNGWYVETEIGARDLADRHRYDMLAQVASDLGLDSSKDSTLWKDEAVVVLCKAVLESFRAADVSMVDHHTAVRQFTAFEQKENKEGRQVSGEWAWLIPPVSPAMTPVWWKKYNAHDGLPAFRYPKNQWADLTGTATACPVIEKGGVSG